MHGDYRGEAGEDANNELAKATGWPILMAIVRAMITWSIAMVGGQWHPAAPSGGGGAGGGRGGGGGGGGGWGPGHPAEPPWGGARAPPRRPAPPPPPPPRAPFRRTCTPGCCVPS